MTSIMILHGFHNVIWYMQYGTIYILTTCTGMYAQLCMHSYTYDMHLYWPYDVCSRAPILSGHQDPGPFRTFRRKSCEDQQG